MLERHHFVCKTFFFEAADESLLDGDAAMPANCAEPGANVVVVAPFEVVLAELAALIADGVLRRASSTPARLVKYKADLGARGSPLKNSKAERAPRPVVNDDCNPPAEGPGLGEGKGQPTGPESCAGLTASLPAQAHRFNCASLRYYGRIPAICLRTPPGEPEGRTIFMRRFVASSLRRRAR